MDAHLVSERITAKLAGRGEEYRKYFKEKLEKWNVSSPSEIPDDKKGAFFEEVERDWSSNSEKSASTFSRRGSLKKNESSRQIRAIDKLELNDVPEIVNALKNAGLQIRDYTIYRASSGNIMVELKGDNVLSYIDFSNLRKAAGFQAIMGKDLSLSFKNSGK